VKIVVVLRHVGNDAQFVWNGHRQHVFGIEQRWNTEMFAGHIKRLQHRIATVQFSQPVSYRTRSSATAEIMRDEDVGAHSLSL